MVKELFLISLISIFPFSLIEGTCGKMVIDASEQLFNEIATRVDSGSVLTIDRAGFDEAFVTDLERRVQEDGRFRIVGLAEQSVAHRQSLFQSDPAWDDSAGPRPGALTPAGYLVTGYTRCVTSSSLGKKETLFQINARVVSLEKGETLLTFSPQPRVEQENPAFWVLPLFLLVIYGFAWLGNRLTRGYHSRFIFPFMLILMFAVIFWFFFL